MPYYTYKEKLNTNFGIEAIFAEILYSLHCISIWVINRFFFCFTSCWFFPKIFQKSLNYFTKFKAETFHCEVIGPWPECNHIEKKNDTYVQQIKPDETRDVFFLIKHAQSHMGTWRNLKRVIFNLDFATILPFLIWIFSFTWHGSTLKKRSCLWIFLPQSDNWRSRSSWGIDHCSFESTMMV